MERQAEQLHKEVCWGSFGRHLRCKKGEYSRGHWPSTVPSRNTMQQKTRRYSIGEAEAAIVSG